MTELKRISEAIWVAEAGLRFFKAPFKTRMTVVRLGDGSLWLHSPAPLKDVRAELDDLGPVRWRIAPNSYHHLSQADYQTAYPESVLYAPKALRAKRPDLRIDHILGEKIPDAWQADFDAETVAGNAYMEETVFLHRPSRTLIVTDLVTYFRRSEHWLVRLYSRMNGVYDKVGVTYGLRYHYKDRRAARRSIERILSWDFDRLIMCHGPVVETGAKDVLREAFDWLLKS